MHFKSLVKGDSLPVTVAFGDKNDVRAISRWRAPKTASGAARDALEFARPATKRWQYYRRSIPCAQSIGDLSDAARDQRETEICLILLAKASWFSASSPIGLAQCRRTYCNHLILEFLAVHPKVIAQPDRAIQGIGSGLLFTLGVIALQSGIPMLWGEATAYSAPFYRKSLGIPNVEDLFIAREPELQHCLKGFNKYFGELDHA